MLSIYPVESGQDLDRHNPLYVGNFFPLTKMWWRKRKQRQGLILSMALAWKRLATKNKAGYNFIEEEILITSLTKQVKDAKVILDRFFTVKRIGFNFGNGKKSPSIVVPKKLPKKMISAIDEIVNKVYFSPGLPPTGNFTVSKVFVQLNNRESIICRLVEEGRDSLIPQVKWLFEQSSPIEFYFAAAGDLQARDKSVWPIKSIELWPGWLRTDLFGPVVDLENAYTQFLLSKLREKYSEDQEKLFKKYPDLMLSYTDKNQFREKICVDILHLPFEEEYISVVKRLVMSLANGSNISPSLVTSAYTRSEAVRILMENCPHLSITEMLNSAVYLQKLCRQFNAAKRELCVYLLKCPPTKKNIKKIFRLYFDWEREARYKIWKIANCTGLHLHDGIDGIIVDDQDVFIDNVRSQTGLMVAMK